MNKTQATDLARSLVSKHLLDEWDFDWNNRKSALGVCNYRKKTIYLSEYFLGRVTDDEIKDTILHEIAHALTWVFYHKTGHGPVWKRICRQIGAKPQRCYHGEVKNEDSQYTVKCPKCSFSFARHRFNKSKLNQLKNGKVWFNCKCKQSRMNIHKNGVKIIDGNASKAVARPKLETAGIPDMTFHDMIALTSAEK